MPTLRRSALAAVLFWTAGCGGDSTGPDAAEIVVSPTPITMPQHQTAQLSVSVLDADGSLISGVAVTFRSNDESLVTVNATGLITSVGKAGQTTVSVRSTGLTKNVPVTVTATSSGITLDPNPAVVPQLGTLQLVAVVTDAVGDPVPGAPVTFTTSNALVATVSPTGVVTASGPAGQATVFAQSGALVGQTAVVVTQVPTTLEFGPDPLTLAAGGSVQLAARVLDAVGEPIGGRPITYAATPASLLEISAGGRITSIGPTGSGTATAQSGTLQATIGVNVVDAARPAGVIAATVPLGGQPYGVAISPSGQLLVSGIGGVLHRAQLPALTFTSAATGGVSTDVAFNPAGTRAWVSNAPDGQLTEYDVTGSTPVALRTIPFLAGDLFGIKVSTDGGLVFVGTGDGRLLFVNSATGAVVHAATVGGGVVHVAMNASGTKVYGSSPTSGNVVEVDVVSHATREFVLDGGAAQGVATAVDDSELYVVSENGGLEIFGLASEAHEVVALGCGGYGLGITPDNTHLYVSCSAGESGLRIIDRASRTEVDALELPGVGRRIAVAPNGLTVAVAVEGGHVVLIE
jgi:adhesin/invasin